MWALFLVAAVLAAAGCNGDGDGGTVAGGGPWQRTAAPANGLSGLDAVRIGDKVVVVGGADYDQTEVKALVLDLRSGRWTKVAPSGLPWRAGHSVVAAGGEAIVWGGGRRAAAVYDPARDHWRRVDPGPLAARSRHAAVWTGEEMIVWGGIGDGRLRADGAAYDPHAGRWRRIAPGPLRARIDHAAVWTGEEMIVWGGSRPTPDDRTRVLRDGAAYDPERDAWRRTAPAPLDSAPLPLLGQGVEAGVDAAWIRTRMTVWNGARGALYDPRRDRWEAMPLSPLRRWLPEDTAVWTGAELIVFGGDAGAAYDPARRRWTMLPPAPIGGRDRHAAVWTGDAMLVFGGCCRGSRQHHDGALYSPR